MNLAAFGILTLVSVIVLIITVAHLTEVQREQDPRRRHRQENVGMLILLVSSVLTLIGGAGTLWGAFQTIFLK